MNDAIYYLAGAIFMAVGIAVSIGLHELGHMLPAKRYGVKVSRFMIGFGPTLFARKRGETEYGLKLIPLGGYVNLLGMQPPVEEFADRRVPKNRLASAYLRYVERYRGPSELGPEEQHRAFYRLPAGKRLIIMAGGPFANLLLGLLFSGIVLGGIGIEQPTNRIDYIVACVPDQNSETCGAERASIASQIDLAPGDLVVSINNQQIADATEVRSVMSALVGQTVNIEIIHDGVLRTEAIQISDYQVWNVSTGAYETRPFLGVGFAWERKPADLATYGEFVSGTIGGTFAMIAQLPQQAAHAAGAIIGTEQRANDGAVSVVGITKVAGDLAIESDGDWTATIAMWLLTLASLNFALFAFNMIPVLPLDGGHLLAAVFGKVKQLCFRVTKRGNARPVDLALLAPFTMIGWVALTAMGLLFVFADIVAPIAI